MIFDTKRKAEAQSPAYLKTNTLYYEKKTLELQAAIKDFLATLWIRC